MMTSGCGFPDGRLSVPLLVLRPITPHVIHGIFGNCSWSARRGWRTATAPTTPEKDGNYFTGTLYGTASGALPSCRDISFSADAAFNSLLGDHLVRCDDAAGTAAGGLAHHTDAWTQMVKLQPVQGSRRKRLRRSSSRRQLLRHSLSPTHVISGQSWESARSSALAVKWRLVGRIGWAGVLTIPLTD